MRTWKVGEIGWLMSCDGYEGFKPQQVVIEGTNAGGLHFIKAKAKDGSIFYCSPSELRTRRAKAVRSATPAMTAEQKEKVSELTERRMQQIMTDQKEQNRKQFELVRDGVRSIERVGQLYEETNGGNSDDWARVKALAEAGLFAEAYAKD